MTRSDDDVEAQVQYVATMFEALGLPQTEQRLETLRRITLGEITADQAIAEMDQRDHENGVW